MDFKKYLQMVSESESQQDVVDTMASYGAEDDIDEGMMDKVGEHFLTKAAEEMISLLDQGHTTYELAKEVWLMPDDKQANIVRALKHYLKTNTNPAATELLSFIDSTNESVKSNKKKSLKDWFEQVDKKMIAEGIPPGMKPMAILDPANKQAGAGVLSSSDPTIQKMLGSLDPKDVKVVMTTQAGSTAPGANKPTTGTTTNQPAQSGTTTNQPAQLGTTTNQPAQSGLSTGGGATTVKEEDIMEKAPPGMEDVVLKLKKQYPGDESRAFKIAWSIYNKKHGKNLKESANIIDFATAKNERKNGKLIDRVTGKSLKIGDTVEGFRGKYTITGWTKPPHPGSTGRVHTDKGSFYPSVIAAVIKSDVEEAATPMDAAKKAEQRLINLYHRVKKGENVPFKNIMNARKAVIMTNQNSQVPSYIEDILIKEAEIPHAGPDYGAGLGAGRNPNVLETKKVNEAMNTLEAAYHEGKSHGLSKHSYACRYDEGTEEHRRYHDGYKEGLDECYGLQPNQGLVDESEMQDMEEGKFKEMSIVSVDGRNVDTNSLQVDGVHSWDAPDFADAYFSYGEFEDGTPLSDDELDELGLENPELLNQLAHENHVEEGNAFTGKLATTPKGGKFSLGGKTFTDTSSYSSELDEYAFESLDKKLNALLNEGLSVNMSQGLGGPTGQGEDTVSVTATGDDSAKLLDFIKQVGLGGLGGGDDAQEVHGEEPALAVISSDYGAPKFSGHDGMKDLMAKITGGDYEEEGDGEESEESEEGSSCDECGMSEGCGCEEATNETETPDQATDEMAEDAAGEEQEEETTADEDAEAEEDETKPASGGAVNESKKLDEKWAGDAEIKSTGQYEGKTLAQLESMLAKLKKSGPHKTGTPENKRMKQIMFAIRAKKGWKGGVKEESLNEWANEAGKDGTEASFERDIEFMTKVIAGGLNKPKSTGQTTIPVIANQDARTSEDDVAAWKKLAGLGK